MQISSPLAAAWLVLTALYADLSAQEIKPETVTDPWRVLDDGPEFARANRLTSDYLDAVRRSRPVDFQRQRAAISDRLSLLAYQHQVRQAIQASFGEPLERTPLNSQLAGTLTRDGFRIEKVIFESRPRNYVTANVYVPSSGKGPFPAILCPVGHWGAGKACEDYQQFGAYFARRGFVVLCYDGPGQGERVQTYDPLIRRPFIHPGTSEYFVTTEHGYLGSYAFLASSFAAYLLWDGIRALDYLQQRSDVDKTRIACSGASGGGTQTRQLAALDERIRVAVPVAYGGCNADMLYATGVSDADIDALIAPRPLLLVCASGDGAAGNERKRRGFEELATLYETVGARKEIEFMIFTSRHGYTSPMYPLVHRWLAACFDLSESAAENVVDAPIELEPEAALACTLSGQVKTSLGGETIASLARGDASRSRQSTSRPTDPETWRSWQHELRARVATRLGIDRGDVTPLQPRLLRRSEHERFVEERIVFYSDPGVYVPSILLLPALSRPTPAVIFLHEESKSGEDAAQRYWLPLVRAGYAVLAIDPRGTGETSEGPAPREYRAFISGTDADLFYGALRAGVTVPGMQVKDVLAACDFLQSRPEIDATKLGILGIGSGGTLAMFAASLDPRIQVTVSSGGLLSYDSLLASGAASAHRLTELVPGALASFDLPDVAGLVAPRHLVLANLVDGRRQRVDWQLARHEYGQAQQIFKAFSSEDKLHVVNADTAEAVIQHLAAAF